MEKRATSGGSPLTPRSSSQGPSTTLTRKAAASRLQNFVRQKQRSKEYMILRKEFHSALGRNAVGRALLTDPHVANARLKRDMTQPPVHTARKNNPFEDTINMSGHFPSIEEHSATFTHEAIHKFNHQTQPTIFEQRRAQNGTHPGWSNAEEEFVITGRNPHDKSTVYSVPSKPGYSAFNENAARVEMGLKVRNSHAGSDHDLPSMMNAQEYAEYQRKQREAEPLDQNPFAPPKGKIPSRFQKK